MAVALERADEQMEPSVGSARTALDESVGIEDETGPEAKSEPQRFVSRVVERVNGAGRRSGATWDCRDGFADEQRRRMSCEGELEGAVRNIEHCQRQRDEASLGLSGDEAIGRLEDGSRITHCLEKGAHGAPHLRHCGDRYEIVALYVADDQRDG